MKQNILKVGSYLGTDTVNTFTNPKRNLEKFGVKGLLKLPDKESLDSQKWWDVALECSNVQCSVKSQNSRWPAEVTFLCVLYLVSPRVACGSKWNKVLVEKDWKQQGPFQIQLPAVVLSCRHSRQPLLVGTGLSSLYEVSRSSRSEITLQKTS